MATLRDIKRRITGVSNTQQITKAMKMVAAAKLRRAQDNIINAKPYANKISEVLYNLMQAESDIDNALVEERPVEKIALVVVTSDSGLCGAFNMNIIREVENLINTEYKELNDSGNIYLYSIGKKGYEYFNRRHYNFINHKINIFGKLNFSVVEEITDELKSKFINREIDKVIIVFNEFKSVIQQKLNIKQLLPIAPEATNEEEASEAEFIYEPTKSQIINSLLPKYLNIQVWRALLDSYAAELGARMTAMDLATENAGELIKSLKMQFNKERQAAITKEILEIVGGADALKKG